MSENAAEIRLDKVSRSFFDQWKILEFTLAMYLGRLLLTDQFRARIIWDRITSMQARLDLVRKLVATYIEEPEKGLVLMNLSKIDPIKTMRNSLAHSLYSLDHKDPNLILINQDQSYSKTDGVQFLDEKRLPLNDLEEAIKQLQSISMFFGSRGNYTTPVEQLRLNVETKWHRQNDSKQ